MAGNRIVDFTANMSGPFATMILGDQGADVIKVEPLTGDIIRAVGIRSGGVSAYFANLNRSKRSIALDLTDERSHRVIDALLDSADVVVHNFRPGLDVKFGLDAQTVCGGRPRLIYAAINGFGSAGPYGGQPAYDHVIQAMSGIVALQGVDSDPGMVRQGLVDKTTGLSAAQAITAALLQRATTGRGQQLEIQMLGVASAFVWPDGMITNTVVGGENNEPEVARTFRLTRTADGHLSFVLVTAARLKRLALGLGVQGAGALTDTGPVRAAGPILKRCRTTVLVYDHHRSRQVAPLVGYPGGAGSCARGPCFPSSDRGRWPRRYVRSPVVGQNSAGQSGGAVRGRKRASAAAGACARSGQCGRPSRTRALRG